MSAFVELTKMRISIMVVLTFVVAAIVSQPQFIDPWIMLWGTVGCLLICFSGNAMNMYVERKTDSLMPRTAGRPLPADKLTSIEVLIFGAATFVASTAIFWNLVNWQTAVCAAVNWIVYVIVYTPLKRKTWFNTEIGAVAGALPVIMGALATTETVPLVAWAFFGVLVFWQFPHFMAIAWKYRHEYKAGGLQMLTVVDPSGKRAGFKSVVTCVLLILCSLIPVVEVRTIFHVILLVTISLIVGAPYLKASIGFNADPNDITAKKLMRSSLLYLPLYMAGLLIVYLT
ncbi:Protoheme IX farnesyltransferase 1 [Mariniblastus fucicola]|uniref:Heme o synthase n=2 Tax=Mariniblastus fucicola TaxID=980251 RepID=A0A5B9PIJ3_9BACT|nr:Protoheme IX farnesyltransferase 1 [Mariniblastus fucicola]